MLGFGQRFRQDSRSSFISRALTLVIGEYMRRNMREIPSMRAVKSAFGKASRREPTAQRYGICDYIANLDGFDPRLVLRWSPVWSENNLWRQADFIGKTQRLLKSSLWLCGHQAFPMHVG